MDENLEKTNDKNPKVLRTYTSDMADVIRENEISVIKIALAEKEKREQEDMYQKAEGSNTSKVFLVIGGIILIVAAIIGSYLLLEKKKEKEIPQTTVDNIDTFISYDSKSYIDTTNIDKIDDLSVLIKQEQPINLNSIKALFFTKKINNIPEIITSNDFLSLVETKAPGALTRSLSGKFLLGKYSDESTINKDNKSAIFLILETTDYSQAYASMLEWEKTMLKDLFLLFDINISSSDDLVFEKTWKDIIINNKDARVLYGEDSQALLYYVFINKNDFIITNNINALKEVTERILTKNAKPINIVI